MTNFGSFYGICIFAGVFYDRVNSYEGFYYIGGENGNGGIGGADNTRTERTAGEGVSGGTYVSGRNGRGENNEKVCAETRLPEPDNVCGEREVAGN